MASSSSSSIGGVHARRRRPVRVLEFLLRGEQRIRRVKKHREKMEPFNQKFYKWKKKTKQEFCQRCNLLFRSLGLKIRLELYSFHTSWKFRIVSVRLQQEEDEGDYEDAVPSEHEHEEEGHQNLEDPYEDVVASEHEQEEEDEDEQEQEQERHRNLEDPVFENYWDPNQSPNEDEEDDGNPNEGSHEPGNQNRDGEHEDNREHDPNSGEYEDEQHDPEPNPNENMDGDGDGDKEDEIDERRRGNPNSREDEEEHRERNKVGRGRKRGSQSKMRHNVGRGSQSQSQSDDEYLKLSSELVEIKNVVNNEEKGIAKLKKKLFAESRYFCTLAKTSTLARLILMELPIKRSPLMLMELEERINREMRKSLGQNVPKLDVPTSGVFPFLVRLFNQPGEGFQLIIEDEICYVDVDADVGKETKRFKKLEKLIAMFDELKLREKELDQRLEDMRRN